MRTTFRGLILLSAVAIWAAGTIQPLNVRVGLWETTTTTSMNGALPIPDELLSKLTPEQRARMEERMKASSGEKNRSNTFKNCMTKEKIEKGADFGKDDTKCTRTIITSTSSKAEVHMACDMSGMKGEGTVQVDVLSPESIKGSVHMTVNGGGHTMNSNSTFTSKWIGQACGDIR
jgi:Protein of unknown function (DUF3617)